MIEQCFQVTLPAQPQGPAQFDLRYGAGDVPLRVILRPFVRRAILEGWLGPVETPGPRIDLPPDLDLATPCLVLREGGQVALLWGGLALGWRIAEGRLRPEWPSPEVHAATAQAVPRPRMPVLDWGPQDVDGADGAEPAPRIAAIPIRGAGMVRIPDSLPPAQVLALWADAAQPDAGWLATLAALAPDAPLPAPPGPAAALVLACLMPGRPAPPPPPGPGPDAAGLAAIAALNGWASPAHRPPRAAPATPALPPAPPATPATLVPGLDIVVALYNQRDRVLECLAGLLPPGRDDLRVLVVDDGSTDGSGDLVARHSAHEPRLRVLAKPNGGCASARNYGRLMSDRSHLAFVDADDATDPGFHAGLYDLARATGACLAVGGFDLWDGARRTAYPAEVALFDRSAAPEAGDDEAWPVDPARLIPSQPAIWRAVHRRDLLDRHDLWFPESIRAFDDFEFHLRVLIHARSLWVRPGLRYLYRQHPGQDVRQRDLRHVGNLAMAATVLRDLARTEGDRTPAVIDALARVIGWSAGQVPPALTGDYLRAAADLWVTIETGLGQGLLPRPHPGGLAHADFPAHLAQARARAAGLPQGRWWLQTEPALTHPATAALARALTQPVPQPLPQPVASAPAPASAAAPQRPPLACAG
jgi:hypothetical protein